MISNNYGEYDKLSVDEKIKIGVEISLVQSRLRDWNDKDSGIVWE
jgi:hypothetical protein